MITDKQALILLDKFIVIKSVSSDYHYKTGINKTVNFLTNLLKSTGFATKIICSKNGQPLIFASFNNNSKKTIAIYGHYDVQPADIADGWNSDPFGLTIKNNRLYGRGVADNKGTIIQNITSIHRLIDARELRNNIIMIIEGEEESGSINFENYCNRLKPELSKSDLFFITDTGVHDKNTPQIFYGLRGIVGFKLEIKTGQYELHSGVYGNRVYNAAQIACYIGAKLKNLLTNTILIDGFYDHVRKCPAQEINMLSKAIKPQSCELNEAGVKKLLAIAKLPSELSSKVMPSLDIHSIISGYQGPGIKNVIPNKAILTADCRIVENQTPNEIKTKIEKYIKRLIPEGVEYLLTFHGYCHPFYCDYNNKYLQKSAYILSKHFKNECIFNRSGGSIPAAEIITRLFKKPIVITGFTNSDCNIHGVNENFDKDLFTKGINVMQSLYNI